MSGGPGTPDQWPELDEPRFGPVGEDVAHEASSFLAALEGEAPPHEAAEDGMVLDGHDRLNLDRWIEIVTGLDIIEVPPEVPPDERAKLHEAVTAFHTAMPFTEAERRWLITVGMEGDDATHELSEVIARKTDEIMAAGVRQPVSGRELMRRWAAWRREADEFAGQGSLEMARMALRGMRTLLNRTRDPSAPQPYRPWAPM
jgi:hypothetical protein